MGAASEGIEEDWLGAAMYWSNWDAVTNRRLVLDAGFELVSAEEVTDGEEHGDLEEALDVAHLWVMAHRPESG